MEQINLKGEKEIIRHTVDTVACKIQVPYFIIIHLFFKSAGEMASSTISVHAYCLEENAPTVD